VNGIEYGNIIACALEDGIINNREFLRLLKETNYKRSNLYRSPKKRRQGILCKTGYFIFKISS